MRFRTFLPTVALILGGCFLGIGDCSYEHRTLELTGMPGAADVAVALNETRNADPDFRVLNITLTGSLASAPTSATLLDGSTVPATVLAAWTQGNAQAQFWDANLDLMGPSPTHESLAALANAGKLSVEITFGPEGNDGAQSATLAVRTDGHWMHPRCD